LLYRKMIDSVDLDRYDRSLFSLEACTSPLEYKALWA
jgi:hypothetical protein